MYEAKLGDSELFFERKTQASELFNTANGV